MEDFGMKSWAEKEVKLACEKEIANSETDMEWDYGVACYKSALKAYHSLMNDGHSGFSIGITKNILNKLIDNKPLTPIEDTDDIWDYAEDRTHNLGYYSYQCKRMSSLFKHIYPDGTIKYKDVDSHYCIDVDTGISYHSGLVSRIIDELNPIQLPYYPPDNPIKVYCEEFLTDRRFGDFDTIGILYMVDPYGEKTEINRFFVETEDGWNEITQIEYDFRKVDKIL